MAKEQVALRGEQCASAKLTEDQVREIRRRVKNGERQKDIAKEYGLQQWSISDIVRRRNWKHVED